MARLVFPVYAMEQNDRANDSILVCIVFSVLFAKRHKAIRLARAFFIQETREAAAVVFKRTLFVQLPKIRPSFIKKAQLIHGESVCLLFFSSHGLFYGHSS